MSKKILADLSDPDLIGSAPSGSDLRLSYDPCERFGRLLVEVRRGAGFSQEGLAHESGVARSYLSGVERGVRNISLMNICILASALGVSPAHLLGFSTEPDEPRSKTKPTKGRPPKAKADDKGTRGRR